ncbi:UDP-glycosyltransferase 90A1-like [Senna tora]|uniref:Glycosyltransferase n=1 Tax=Senna tora TaxID=362788 RepID=A0A834XFL5_9FABA|nr:UDP-glycosyltransferase 90A1-like [Senna tora]
MGSIVEEADSSQPHVLLFPFMSKGHTIPLLHFARLLLRRHVTLTLITTPANRPFISHSLRHHPAAAVIDIPFPTDVPGIPAGVESTDQLPSMSLFSKFAAATARMQPHLERVLATLPLPRVSLMVSDGFLWWTLQSASKFDIPRLVYYGMSCHANALTREAFVSGVFSGPQHRDELVPLTRFPWIRVCKNDFPPEFSDSDPTSLAAQFHTDVVTSAVKSFGTLVNSFYELEPVFVDYLSQNSTPHAYYCVGPLCLAEEEIDTRNLQEAFPKKASWIEWLDKKHEESRTCGVVYVAFGSQAEISHEQLKEIAYGLEESQVPFLWVIRRKEWESQLPEGFEERVGDKGMIVRDWVDQREILNHEGVKGFVSHCGWNSVLEAVCAGVPILAMPMMAEQYLNARMVEEEMKVGMRVETCDGSVRGFVRREGVRKKVRELMMVEGEKGEEVRRKVGEVAEMAKKAVEDGGSSWRTLENLLVETCKKKKT